MFGANNRSEHFFIIPFIFIIVCWFSRCHSFLLCRCSLTSTLQKPCICFALSSVSGTLYAIATKTCANASEKCLFFYRTMTPNGGLTRQRSENEHSVLLTCNLYEVGLTNSS